MSALGGTPERLAALEAEVAELRAAYERACDELAVSERQNAELLKLHVALRRLHETPTRESALAALSEIVVNIVGSEAFAVLEARGAAQPVVAASMGLDTATVFGLTATPTSRVAGALQRGETWIATGGATIRPGEPMACVPLKLGGAVVGALVIDRLLPHKATLEELDRELLEMLTTHGALALHAGSLQLPA